MRGAARLRDPRWLLRQLRIVDKNKRLARLDPLWEEQEMVEDAFYRSQNILILKCRQVGITTIIMALFFVKYLLARNPRMLLQVGHEGRIMHRLNAQWRTHVRGLPRLIRPPLDPDNKRMIGFGHNGALIEQIMAGGRNQARGDTYSDLHATEFFKWPRGSAAAGADADTAADADMWQSAMATIHDPDAHVIAEGTADGPRGFGYELFKTAREDPEWELLFMPWQGCRRYARPFASDAEAVRFESELEPDEFALRAQFDLSLEQLAWRRWMLHTKGYTPLRFRREYPMTEMDPFLLDLHGWFDQEVLSGALDLIPPGHDVKDSLVQHHPLEPGRLYAFGVDTAGGVGLDSFAIQVFDDLQRQCAVYHSNAIGPKAQAVQISKMGAMYGGRERVFAVIEANHFGRVVLDELKAMGPAMNVSLYVDPHTGRDFYSTGGRAGATKHAAYSHARDWINQDWVLFSHPETVRQLMTIVEKPNGRIEGEGSSHDDLADAVVLALWGLRTKRWVPGARVERTERERYEALRRRARDPLGNQRR